MAKRGGGRKASDLQYVALQLESLTELLIERGVITRQDLERAMKVVDLDDDKVDGGLRVDAMRRALKPRAPK
jgi:hypothetical protein